MTSKKFLTLEEAIDYIHQLDNENLVSDNEEIEISQLAPKESGNITDEENIQDNVLEKVVPADVCGEIVVTANLKEREETSCPSTSKKAMMSNPVWKKTAIFSEKIEESRSEKILADQHPELIPLELRPILQDAFRNLS
ncbi:hypothetical protein ANN_13317 [Periplaneta americana]|uniref:Uncharacterized protein n=1 Tax=Periplaneta americana TaxID=6978 RepID=A0ABQ8TJ92_PERAM|nr:hypothetical protein ANN_13317 [Periplaneta americana]